ncbi:MAG TPA: OmpH family outer membrane protein, partial [Alphaproteobacteria bacterium]|nr:OmpH family outer membrane protein [Alphaproteobacteria bacterium]
MSRKLLLATSVVAVLSASPAMAASDADLEALRAEIQSMRQAYESKIDQLETKVQALESQQNQTAQAVEAASVAPAAGGENVSSSQSSPNAFNPAIGAVLNGHYGAFTNDNPDVAGFAVGEEGGRTGEGLAVDEAEINFSANVDDKFAGKLTASLAEEDGETSIELEEAYVQTTALPAGLNLKAGRFLQPIGYINEHHAHTDDFADRPLPNRVFLNNSYKDDGVMASIILPTDMYFELGGN